MILPRDIPALREEYEQSYRLKIHKMFRNGEDRTKQWIDFQLIMDKKRLYDLDIRALFPYRLDLNNILTEYEMSGWQIRSGWHLLWGKYYQFEESPYEPSNSTLDR